MLALCPLLLQAGAMSNVFDFQYFPIAFVIGLGVFRCRIGNAFSDLQHVLQMLCVSFWTKRVSFLPAAVIFRLGLRYDM